MRLYTHSVKHDKKKMQSIKALTVSPIFIDENISYHKSNHQSTLEKGSYLANVNKTYLTNWFTKLGHLKEVTVFSQAMYILCTNAMLAVLSDYSLVIFTETLKTYLYVGKTTC